MPLHGCKTVAAVRRRNRSGNSASPARFAMLHCCLRSSGRRPSGPGKHPRAEMQTGCPLCCLPCVRSHSIPSSSVSIKKSKRVSDGSPHQDAFAFTPPIIHLPQAFVKGFLKSFLKNLAKSEIFDENGLTFCKMRAIILAYEQWRSWATATAVSP